MDRASRAGPAATSPQALESRRPRPAGGSLSASSHQARAPRTGLRRHDGPRLDDDLPDFASSQRREARFGDAADGRNNRSAAQSRSGPASQSRARCRCRSRVHGRACARPAARALIADCMSSAIINGAGGVILAGKGSLNRTSMPSPAKRSSVPSIGRSARPAFRGSR